MSNSNGVQQGQDYEVPGNMGRRTIAQKSWTVSITHRQEGTIKKDSTYIRCRSSSRGGAGEQHGGGILEFHGYVVVGLFTIQYSKHSQYNRFRMDGVFTASMIVV